MISSMICPEEGGRALQGKTIYLTRQDSFVALCRATLDNRLFVEEVTLSRQGEYIETYLFRMIYEPLYDVVEELSTGYTVFQEDQQYIRDFYKYAFVSGCKLCLLTRCLFTVVRGR